MKRNVLLISLAALVAGGLWYFKIQKPSAKFQVGDQVRVTVPGYDIVGTVEEVFWGPDYGLPKGWFYNLTEQPMYSFAENQLEARYE